MQLRNGPIVRDSAVALAIQLEARGFQLTADAGALKVTNGSALTAEDRAAIIADKAHLLAIVDYCERRPYEAVQAP